VLVSPATALGPALAPPSDPALRSGHAARSDQVQSFARGLAVIRALGSAPGPLTLAEVARRSGMTRAAARRLLLTLVEEGYARAEDRGFSLRPRVLELGWAYLSTLGLDEVAVPHMEQLVAEVRESSSIAVLDGDDVVYVVRVPTSRIMAVTIAVGTRFPAHATSMGRVLLAALSAGERDAYLHRAKLEPLTPHTVTDPVELGGILERVATERFALVDQELEIGLRSVAVPVRDRRGVTMAALNVSAHASRACVEDLRRRILPRVRDTAERITQDLRAVGVGSR
jgi:IclR family pca regulon transcriptional regulator